MFYPLLGRKLSVLSLTVFLAWPSLAVLRAQETAAPAAYHPTLEDFSWLAGRWEGKLGPMTAEQQWMAPKNGTMQGLFRLTDTEKTIVIELFTIRESPVGIVSYFRPFSP